MIARSSTERAFAERDVAAVDAGDVAGDRQSKAGIAHVLVAGVIEPIERLEHVVAFGRRNSRPVVVDLDAQPVPLGRRADDDLIAETRGIANEVGIG